MSAIYLLPSIILFYLPFSVSLNPSSTSSKQIQPFYFVYSSIFKNTFCLVCMCFWIHINRSVLFHCFLLCFIMFSLCALSALQDPFYYLGITLSIALNSVLFSVERPLLQWWLLRMQGQPSTKDCDAPLDQCENETVRSWPWGCTQLRCRGRGAVHSQQGGRIFPAALSLPPLIWMHVPCNTWDTVILKSYSLFIWNLNVTGCPASYWATLWYIQPIETYPDSHPALLHPSVMVPTSKKDMG